MSETILKEILLEVHEIECGVIKDLPDFKPSLRHRLAMKRIFARFERNSRKLRNTKSIQEPTTAEQSARRYRIKQRLLTAAIIIILMTFLAGCVSTIIKFVSEQFHGTAYEDNTLLSAVDIEKCPQTIEYQYVSTNVPEGFELIETVSSPTNVYTLYMNSSTGQVITLKQWVKTHYSTHYNTEKNTFEDISINDKMGLYIDFSSDNRNNTVFIWDNGDYIIEISADLDKKSALDLLNIAKL